MPPPGMWCKSEGGLPDMRAAMPDIKYRHEFDQSGYVINSLKSLLFEGGLRLY